MGFNSGFKGLKKGKKSAVQNKFAYENSWKARKTENMKIPWRWDLDTAGCQSWPSSVFVTAVLNVLFLLTS